MNNKIFLAKHIAHIDILITNQYTSVQIHSYQTGKFRTFRNPSKKRVNQLLDFGLNFAWKIEIFRESKSIRYHIVFL